MNEASDVQLEKVKEWNEKYAEVDTWYKTMTPKIEGNFNIGKTLPIVQKQIADQEVLVCELLKVYGRPSQFSFKGSYVTKNSFPQEISNEMVMTHESVEYLLKNGQELLQNTNTPEAEKNKLRKDIANLVERWESLSNTVNNRMQR